MFVDSHAHYDDKQFDEDRATLLPELFDSGKIIALINPSSSPQSNETVVALSQTYPNVYAAIGVHPHEAQHITTDLLENITGNLSQEKVVAIGEIGLDYHYDFSPRDIHVILNTL
jgi:TatD DNase family protein